MEDKRFTSETFGKYTNSSAFGENSAKDVKEPKNITSDMWTPISGGETYQKRPEPQYSREYRPASEPVRRPNPESGNTAPRQGNRKGTADTRGGANKSGQKTKQQPSQKSRTPKGKPVSAKGAPAQTQGKQRPPQKKAPPQNNRQANAEKYREQQSRKKDLNNYDKKRNEGHNPGEISKQRAAKKRRSRYIKSLVAVFIFLLFVGAFVGIYSYTKGAPIANIIVEGESVYENGEILKSAEVEVGLNMFLLREKQINQKVTTELPYIHSVELDRKLPDTITLTITPTKEKYLIVGKKGYICVDENDKIVSLKKKKLQDGTFGVKGFDEQTVAEGEIYVPSESNKARYELVKRMVSYLEKIGDVKKATINVADMSDVKILYNSKITVYLGDCKDLENRLSLACNVIKSPVTEGKTGYIDMRYDSMAFFNEGAMEKD